MTLTEKLLNISIDEVTVRKKLDKVRPQKAAGIDDCHQACGMNWKKNLLLDIEDYENILETVVVAEDWKTTNFIPIFGKV